MAAPDSWKDLQAEFGNFAKKYDKLYAEYDSLLPGRWTLRGGSPTAERKFHELSALVAAKLDLSAEGNLQPWQSWLEYMRSAGGRRPDIQAATPNAPASRPKPISRPEQRRRTEQGDRTLPHVFQTSADCCGDLAEREQLTAEAKGTPQSNVGTLRLAGPDRLELLIEPYPDGYVWRIRNGSLDDVENLRFEILGVQSFDAEQDAFRKAETAFKGYWSRIPKLGSGAWSVGIIFVTFENGRLRLGQTIGMNWLPWPSGDLAVERRWRLFTRVRWSSKEWPVELELASTLGSGNVAVKLARIPPATPLQSSRCDLSECLEKAKPAVKQAFNAYRTEVQAPVTPNGWASLRSGTPDGFVGCFLPMIRDLLACLRQQKDQPKAPELLIMNLIEGAAHSEPVLPTAPWMPKELFEHKPFRTQMLGAIKSEMGAPPSANNAAVSAVEEQSRKGDLNLLKRDDGSYYRSVDFPTVEKYAGISPRRRQQLMSGKVLEVVGKGQNRRITVESLLAFCPREEDAK
jgi:hypothetical protein